MVNVNVCHNIHRTTNMHTDLVTLVFMLRNLPNIFAQIPDCGRYGGGNEVGVS